MAAPPWSVLDLLCYSRAGSRPFSWAQGWQGFLSEINGGVDRQRNDLVAFFVAL